VSSHNMVHIINLTKYRDPFNSIKPVVNSVVHYRLTSDNSALQAWHHYRSVTCQNSTHRKKNIFRSISIKSYILHNQRCSQQYCIILIISTCILARISHHQGIHIVFVHVHSYIYIYTPIHKNVGQ
jgi:hypothetical protein